MISALKIRPGVLLLMAALVIFTLGLVMIFSTTSADALDHAKVQGLSSQLLKQILFSGAAALLAVGVYRLGWVRVYESTPWIMLGIVVLLTLVLIPGVGKVVNGSRRWLSLGGFSFQPSEFAKFIVPLYFFYGWQHAKGEKNLLFFLKLLAVTLIPIVLIMVEPNNGTALVTLSVLVVVFFLVKVPLKFWAFPLLGMLIIGGVFASQLPYVTRRLQVYLHPELDLRGKGHQPYQAKIAAGSGGLFGKGAAKSLQKLSYLPEAQNDYIAAIWAEEFGFAGVLALILLYLTLLLSGFKIAFLSPVQEGAVIALLIVFLISFQAFLNMGVVSGLLPSTGLNLPLFSQGGTSLMANFSEIALLLSIGENQWQEC
ncbi:MAG: cell division protein FtsW [Chlamydiia bacterium]|nr:cell division protein FtsW [Chlamydiia bacterium]